MAGRVKLGVAFDRILDDIRETVAMEENLSRLHLADKRDLYNIVREYGLDRDIVHKNDAFNTDMWVQEQAALGDDSVVLLYKAQGSDYDGPLKTEDFMIVIMTKYQQAVLHKFASEKVCVDNTHKATDHDFQLTTVLTIDEFKAGCPVAYSISNRVDFVAMAEFFTAVKEKVRSIQAKVFMSDDAPAYNYAWTSIMGSPGHHLICSWLVYKNWRTNLGKINSSSKQSKVYKTCRLLMETTDVKRFEDSPKEFEAMCMSDPMTENFGVYFNRHYSSRAKQWAFCYRLVLGLNTNMFVDATHKKLKYCYMDGKQNRRADKCISLLLRFARDMMFERTIRMIKNKPTFRMEAIAHSHLRSETIPGDYIQAADNSTWIVKSASVGIGPYCVALNSSSTCPGCPLTCPQCNIFVHEFTCTCVDYQIRGNFCKHVHACFRKSKWETLVCASEETKTLAFEEHTSIVIEASKGQAVHVAEAVSEQTRLTALLQTGIGLIDSIPENYNRMHEKRLKIASNIYSHLQQKPQEVCQPPCRTSRTCLLYRVGKISSNNGIILPRVNLNPRNGNFPNQLIWKRF